MSFKPSSSSRIHARRDRTLAMPAAYENKEMSDRLSEAPCLIPAGIGVLGKCALKQLLSGKADLLNCRVIFPFKDTTGRDLFFKGFERGREGEMKHEIEINMALNALDISMPIVDHGQFEEPFLHDRWDLIGYAIFEAAKFKTLV